MLLLMLLLAADPSAADPTADAFPPVPPYAVSDANAGADPMNVDAVFRQFGGRPGIDRIVDDFVARSVADPRISDIFKASDLVRFRRMLGEQFCYILGGGCAYTGRGMKGAHKDMGLQTADLGAVIDNLQRAMTKSRVPFAAQNRLLAKLAPMKRVVVER